MSDMAKRRALANAVYEGLRDRSIQGVAALIDVPVLVAQVLEEVTDGPVRAYLAMGAEDVAALEAFIRSRQGEAEA